MNHLTDKGVLTGAVLALVIAGWGGGATAHETEEVHACTVEQPVFDWVDAKEQAKWIEDNVTNGDNDIDCVHVKAGSTQPVYHSTGLYRSIQVESNGSICVACVKAWFEAGADPDWIKTDNQGSSPRSILWADSKTGKGGVAEIRALIPKTKPAPSNEPAWHPSSFKNGLHRLDFAEIGDGLLVERKGSTMRIRCGEGNCNLAFIRCSDKRTIHGARHPESVAFVEGALMPVGAGKAFTLGSDWFAAPSKIAGADWYGSAGQWCKAHTDWERSKQIYDRGCHEAKPDYLADGGAPLGDYPAISCEIRSFGAFEASLE